MSPEKFALYCVAVLWNFKSRDGDPPLFAWENVGPGSYFTRVVLELEYPRVFYPKRLLNARVGKSAKEPGWSPAGKNKRHLLDAYRAALYNRQCTNYSDIALRECGEYYHTGIGDQVSHPGETNTDDPTGARYNHGDRVIADALAWKMVDELGVLQKGVRIPEEVLVNTPNFRHQHLYDSTVKDPWATSDMGGWQTSGSW